jgi:ATP-dependent Clp protease ATP-binding subunit ClpX
VSEKLQFSLRDWLKHEDLFEYGISPQFLSRFDAVVLLESLTENELLKIFLEGADSGLRQSQAYFASLGCKLQITTAACRRIAREAARQPRLGARALKEAFRRVISPYEFDPAAAAPDATLRIDVPEVEKALRTRGAATQDAASAVAGWDELLS